MGKDNHCHIDHDSADGLAVAASHYHCTYCGAAAEDVVWHGMHECEVIDAAVRQLVGETAVTING